MGGVFGYHGLRARRVLRGLRGGMEGDAAQTMLPRATKKRVTESTLSEPHQNTRFLLWHFEHSRIQAVRGH
jgi:hypothetical protein